MTTMMTGVAGVSEALDPCQVCYMARAQHSVAELAGRLNHRFSSDGLINSLEKRPPTPGAPQVVIANAVDMELRAILLRKGVLDVSDFGAVQHPGASTS